MKLHLSELAKIINGTLHGNDSLVTTININTRELTAGQLFIALQGKQFDGHDFLQSACDKKALGAIVSRNVELPISTIQVEDTRIALGKIAAFHRQQYQIPVIAVTGSCGKTTTTAMMTSILNRMGPTLSPAKSFNNEIGVPLTLLQLNDRHRYAVIEMGANNPGEIAYLSSIASQDIAIITNVAPAHLAGFKTIEGVARAKGEIFEALRNDGVAVINQDDQFADYWKALVKQKKIVTFGIENKADVMAKNIVLDKTGKPEFEVIYPGGKIAINLPLLGRHNVQNALVAIAATFSGGATQEAIVAGLTEVSPVSNRMIEYTGCWAGATVVDDSYNANPLSVEAALNMLAHRKGQKYFIFGDMAELGPEEENFHHKIGAKAKQLGIDKLLAYGKLTKLAVYAFGENGYHFEDQASLLAVLKKQLDANAIVLVKGSRSSNMEKIVQAIIQEK